MWYVLPSVASLYPMKLDTCAYIALAVARLALKSLNDEWAVFLFLSRFVFDIICRKERVAGLGYGDPI